MTAGTTTRSMEGSRISLPRVGLGALLAGTLLAGGLLGAAVYAGISAATSGPAALSAVPVTSPHESAIVRHARSEAGNGQLAGDAGATRASARTRAIPYRGDGFGGDGFSVTTGPGSTRAIPYRGDGNGGDGFSVPHPNIQPPAGTATDAAGHGPLR
jgi:hypothetical protein